MRRRSSFFAKGHIRIGYSVASVIIRLWLITNLLLTATVKHLYGSSFSRQSKLYVACSDFLFTNINEHFRSV